MTNVDVSKIRFNIIHHRGQPNEAILEDGTKINRMESVFILEYGLVKTMPSDIHFCFLFPQNNPRYRWFAGCTCGAPAVIVGSNPYSHYGSPEGSMLICYNLLTFGMHADGSKGG